MNNLLNALRLEIAQLPKFFYVLSGFILLIGLVMYTMNYVVFNVSGSLSSITDEYHYLQYGAIMGIVSLISYVVANIIGGRMMNRLYKKDNILEGFYNLPMSPAGRVAFIAIMLLIVAPLLAIVPILLVMALVCGIEPFGIIAPDFGYLFPTIFSGILAYYITLLIWVYPTVVFRKRDGLVIFGLIALFGITFSFFGGFNEMKDYLVPASVLTEPDVVGLIHESVNFSKSPALVVEPGLPPVSLLVTLVAILTTAAITLGIIKKEA